MDAIFAYKGHPVTVVELYESTQGLRVTVSALQGKPFVGGDKWPVRSAYAVCMAKDLTLAECTCRPDAVEVCPPCRALLRYYAEKYDDCLVF